MIQVSSPTGPTPIPAALVRRAAGAALAQQAAQGNLHVVLADDAMLQFMNRTYLGVDAPTDVLSFPAGETDPDSGQMYLGDILISVPRAAWQAESAGHPVAAEVQLLVIHGVLHLLGHDHAKPEDKARMWIAQAAILQSIGLGEIEVREEP